MFQKSLKGKGVAFQVAAIVTQPGRPRGRGSKKVAQPSPVAQLVLDRGWPEDRILSPVKASEVGTCCHAVLPLCSCQTRLRLAP